MTELAADVTVVGGGIAGLWSAKELIDRGLTVNVVEKSDHLATGATTRNEGWLHAGTYHAVAIYDEADAQNVTARTIYGHDAIVNFAPESVEHESTYAFVKDDELAQAALQRWNSFGVQHREVSARNFAEAGFATKAIRAAFEVKDKSVNSRVICAKLAEHVVDGGGRILTGANFTPTSSTTADVEVDGGTHKLKSGNFLITAGAGTKKVFEEMTGKSFPMRYFKSHLLVAPRVVEDNYFYLDPLEAGIMNHGGASMVGINREAVDVAVPDYEVMADKEQLVHEALLRMLPRAAQLGRSQVSGVACVKIDVADSFRQQNTDPTIVLQDLNIKVFEPAEGYMCAIPGKMTEAPALAKAAADYVMGKKSRNSVAAAGVSREERRRPAVNLRPADHWMQSQLLRYPS